LNKVATQFTVADYCKGMTRNEIIVNKDYQRSDKVWPSAARSYLIETILKGFPVPKLYLYQITDVKSRETHKEIVDGQQRSMAILGFYKDEFKIGKLAENEDTRIITGLRSYPYTFRPRAAEVDVVVPPPFQGSRTQSPFSRREEEMADRAKRSEKPG